MHEIKGMIGEGVLDFSENVNLKNISETLGYVMLSYLSESIHSEEI